MAEDTKSPVEQSVEAVKQPVENWRQKVVEADAVAPKHTRHYRALAFQGYLVGAVIVFLILAVLAKSVAYFSFDVSITLEVQEIHAQWFDALMYALSWPGFAPQGGLIAALVIIFLYISGLKWESIVSAGSVIGSTALDVLIKLVVNRPRPSADLVNVVAQLNSYSFPSGHVLYYTTFFGFLIFLLFTLIKPRWWRTVLMVFLGFCIALIGVSRIYEGEHWASDVIAAYLLGSVWLSLAIYVYRWGKTRFFINQPVAKETPAPSPQ